MARSGYGYQRDDLSTQETQALGPATPPELSLAGKCVTIEGDGRQDGRISVRSTPFDADVIQHIKRLPAQLRSWSPEERAWLCPAGHVGEISLHFKRHGVLVQMDVDTGLVALKMDMVPSLCAADKSVKLARIPAATRSMLFPYQEVGLAFGVQRRGRILLADEPGLGKTVQAVLIAAAFSDSWPLLIVCPSSLRRVWQDHLREWLPEQTLRASSIHCITTGRDAAALMGRSPTPNQVTIVSYDLAKQLTVAFCRAHHFIICDEAHMLKSADSQRTRHLAPLVQQAHHAILVSGTPLQAKPIQLFPLIEMLRPGLFGSRDDFGRRYCGNYKRELSPGNWDYVGSSNTKELHAILRATIMVRRLKQDVLADLPDKLRSSVPVDVSSEGQRELAALRQELKDLDADTYSSQQQRDIERSRLISALYRATGRAKLAGAQEHLRMLLETGDDKVLVFAHHKPILDGLEAIVRSVGCGWVRIDGETTAPRKVEAVGRFQEDAAVRVGLLSIKAAGVGLTLTAASAVVFAELAWDPMDLMQAEDRAHRVGQTKALKVQYLVATIPESADAMMWSKLRSKLDIVSRVVDGRLGTAGDGLRMNDAKHVSPPAQLGDTAQGFTAFDSPLASLSGTLRTAGDWVLQRVRCAREGSALQGGFCGTGPPGAPRKPPAQPRNVGTPGAGPSRAAQARGEAADDASGATNPLGQPTPPQGRSVRRRLDFPPVGQGRSGVSRADAIDLTQDKLPGHQGNAAGAPPPQWAQQDASQLGVFADEPPSADPGEIVYLD